MDPRFIQFVQIHTLTSYPAALLNRDDAGFAKRIPFGGVTRTRISSQCLKRHWRTFEGENGLAELELPMSVRSRLTFDRHVVQPLVAEGLDPTTVRAATEAFMEAVLGKSAKAKSAKKDDKGDKNDKNDKGEGRLETGQVTVLGRPELDYLREEVRLVAAAADGPKGVPAQMKLWLDGERKKNLKALRQAAGLDAALFGRMVTSDLLARTDAAVHVAHAFTVHPEAAESDYFSAIDDILKDEAGELGSGHINSTELTSGLFYGYVVIDVPLLVSNVEGCRREDAGRADRQVTAELVRRLVHLVATVSPGAKLGSTAPYAHAHLVLVETGRAQPRTLANAFLKPVAERPDLLANAYAALDAHLADLDGMYGPPQGRRFAALGPSERIARAERQSGEGALGQLATWAAAQVGGA